MGGKLRVNFLSSCWLTSPSSASDVSREISAPLFMAWQILKTAELSEGSSFIIVRYLPMDDN
jgi:hypothetical protein